jgi:hypothetical protein
MNRLLQLLLLTLIFIFAAGSAKRFRTDDTYYWIGTGTTGNWNAHPHWSKLSWSASSSGIRSAFISMTL